MFAGVGCPTPAHTAISACTAEVALIVSFIAVQIMVALIVSSIAVQIILLDSPGDEGDMVVRP